MIGQSAECETPLLASLLDIGYSLERLLGRQVFDNHRRVFTQMGDHLEERASHRRIYEAVVARDPEAARASASAHVANLAGWLRNVLT
jgi:GntR family transcriptional regulator, transcriptional repressor for pyruvate dehydrogenase complex